jgi:hypothetical protein
MSTITIILIILFVLMLFCKPTYVVARVTVGSEEDGEEEKEGLVFSRAPLYMALLLLWAVGKENAKILSAKTYYAIAEEAEKNGATIL